MSNVKLGPRDSHRGLLKSTSIISLGTLASRILGFVRDIILANILGTGFRADAFFVAQRIPNLLRSFVGEGASDSAIVPVFSEYKIKNSKDEFWRFVSVFVIWALILLSAITLAGIIFAPLVVRLLAPGFMLEPEKLALTISLTRIMFPYLILIGLTAYSVAILYTFHSFTAPAFSPCLFNIATIAGALLSPYLMEEPVYGLAVSVVIGGVLQLCFQIRPMRQQGMSLHRPATLRHPGVIKIGRLLVPRLVGAGVYQLSVLIDTFCASLSAIVGAGGISAIYYANRIIQFPMGLFGIAMASATLPTLSSLSANGDTERFKTTLMFALKNIVYIMLPTTLLTMLLAQPIIRILFERGAFNAYSTAITSSALLFYSIGLFSYGGVKILVSAFYALQDTATPVKVAGVCLSINAVLNFILMFPMGVGGIALASAIAATINFSVLFYFLQKRLGRLDADFKSFNVKVMLASVVMAFAVIAAWELLPLPYGIIKLVLVGAAGYLVYGAATGCLRVEQTLGLGQWLLKRK